MSQEMNIIKALALIFLFLVFLNGVNAFSYDFEHSVINLCADSDSVISGFNITNEASRTIEYSIVLSGDASSNTLVFPSTELNGFLNSKETKNFQLSIVSNSKNFKKKALDVSITADDVKYFRRISVNFNNCHKLNLSKTYDNQTTCVLNPVVYSFNVTNPSTYSEKVKLIVSGNGKEFMKVNNEELIINPGDFKEVFVTFSPSTKDGVFLTTVNVNNDVITEPISFNTTVNNCATFSVNKVETNETSFCENKDNFLKVDLTNTGKKEDFYTVKINSEDLGINQRNFQKSLKNNESHIFTTNIFTTCNTEPGLKKVNILAGSIDSISFYNETIDLNLLNCYDDSFIFKTSNDKSCFCDETSVTFKITNDGLVQRNFQINQISEGLDFETNNFTVDKGKTLILRGSYSNCNPGLKKVGFDLNILEGSECFATQRFEKEIEILNSLQCFNPTITLSQDSFVLTNSENYNLGVSVTNNGFKAANYSILFSGDATEWINLISTDSFELSPTESKSFEVLVVSPEDAVGKNKNINLEVYVNEELIKSTPILFIGNTGDLSSVIGLLLNSRPLLLASVVVFLIAFSGFLIIIFFSNLLKSLVTKIINNAKKRLNKKHEKKHKEESKELKK